MVEALHNVPGKILQQFKNWMLPIAMLAGGIYHSFFAKLAPAIPYLIFLMLLVPSCKISLSFIGHLQPNQQPLRSRLFTGHLLFYR